MISTDFAAVLVNNQSGTGFKVFNVDVERNTMGALWTVDCNSEQQHISVHGVYNLQWPMYTVRL